MGVTIYIPATLQSMTNQNASLRFVPGTIQSVLDELFTRHPALKGRFYTASGTPQPFVRVFYQDTDLRDLPPETPLQDGDTITVVQALAGG